MFDLWLGSAESMEALVDIEKNAKADFTGMLKLQMEAKNMQARGNTFGEDEDGGFSAIGDYLIQKEGTLGIVKVSGSLTNGYRWYHPYLEGQVTSYEAIGDALYTLAEDPDINEIVMAIDSGGGLVNGLDELTNKVARVREVKKVTAHSTSSAYSAAYWMASATERITGTRMSSFGSIGTLLVHQSIAKMAEKAGVEFTVIRAGEFKAIGMNVESLSEDDKKYLQEKVNETNQFFLDHVAQHRNLPLASKRQWAEGRTFYAEEARQLGLVDNITSLSEIVRAAGAQQQPRSNRMLISEQKKAQIKAGAAPEDVLTAEELALWNQTQEEGEGEEGKGEGEGEEGQGEEEGEGEGEGKEGEGQEANAGAGADTGGSEYHKLLRANGKLEAKLESKDETIAELKEQLKCAESRTASLQSIATQSVHTLQTALGKSKETAASPEGLITMYNDLNTEMADRFPRGQKSSDASTKETSVSSVPPALSQLKQDLQGAK